MRRYSFLAVVLALCAWRVALAAGSIMIDDPKNLLMDRKGEVQAAAQRLADAGADVIVMVVDNDGGTDQGRTYINQRLAELKINGSVAAGNSRLPGNTILVFRSTRRGFENTGFYYVPGYKAALDPALKTIFADQMRPKLTTGDTAGGLVAGLDGIRTTINPPTSPLVPITVAAVVLGGGYMLAAPQLQKRKKAATTLAEAKQRLDEARKAAGAAIADLGQLVRVANEKKEYDKLSYARADVQRIAEHQTTGQQAFEEAQKVFDQAELDETILRTPTIEGYDKIAVAYRRAQALTNDASTGIKEAERLRLTLDQTPGPDGPAPGETTRL